MAEISESGAMVCVRKVYVPVYIQSADQITGCKAAGTSICDRQCGVYQDSHVKQLRQELASESI